MLLRSLSVDENDDSAVVESSVVVPLTSTTGTRRTTKTSNKDPLAAASATNGGSSSSSSLFKLTRRGFTSTNKTTTTTSPAIVAIVVAIAICCIASGMMNILHIEQSSTGTMQSHISDNGGGGIAMALADFKQTKKTTTTTISSSYPTLQCQAYGGPSELEAQEMVYWQEIPSDSKYVSPFHAKKGRKEQYMTFEPDGGGWNNIRMAMETVVGLAVATGRTLVLPPEQRMYLLAQERNHKTDFSFMDFFPMKQLAADNDGLTIITMEEFLQRHAMTGQMMDKTTGKVSYPPDNVTDWNGKDVKILKEWLRNVTYTPLWSPGQCLAVFPASGELSDAEKLQQLLQQINSERLPTKSVLEHPLPVDTATIKERMYESLAGRRELCLYNAEMQAAPVLHFMCYHKMNVRMLVHFYAFLFFEDWREDLWMKRLMRDHMRYVDELQCAAARIVSAIRQRARARNPRNNSAGVFDSFHIRRGDFQYKNTRIEADEIYNNVKDILTEGSTVYIATDERKKEFFDPLKKHYDVLFMNDFMPQLEGVNKNMYGMIDQLVASRGRIFFGCWHSTFTGFINRMRGYHSVREQLPGHEDGLLLNSYYYVPAGQKLILHKYAPLNGAFFNREFPTSWRQLDKGIGKLPPHVALN